MTVDFLFNGPAEAAQTIVLTHGAGAAMDTPFMNAFAEGLAAKGYRVARFEFPYMVRRREEGRKFPPNRAPILMETWMAAIEALGPAENLVISGKSMGGRIATLVADDAGVKAVIPLGYPFYAMGKPDTPRIEHLETIKTPTLIVQGTRDGFGKQEQVETFPLSSAISVKWLEDGDHGFKPRKKSGRTEEQNWAEGIEAMDAFIKGLQA